MATVREAYQLAKGNNGAPDSDVPETCQSGDVFWLGVAIPTPQQEERGRDIDCWL
jgi:hypothetical protein